MSRTVRLIQGKGDWAATPPTGASDADLYQLANDFIVQAGVINKDGNDALVTETSPTGFKVKIAKGTIYVQNSSWIANSNVPKFYQIVADADEELNIATNSSGSTRVDLIAQKIDKITAPNDQATNVSPLVVVQGTPGAGAPALPNDHELLATLSLADGYAAVTNAMITDNRKQVYLETKDINAGFQTLTDSATITINLSSTRKRKFIVSPIAGNRNITITNAKEGDAIYLKLVNDGTPRSPVFTNTMKWIGIENNPLMADYVDANKIGAFLFICTNQTTQAFDGYFLGAEQ